MNRADGVLKRQEINRQRLDSRVSFYLHGVEQEVRHRKGIEKSVPFQNKKTSPLDAISSKKKDINKTIEAQNEGETIN